MNKLLIIFILLFSIVKAQTVMMPNVGSKSHPTLTITKIQFTQSATIIELAIENKIENGWFCADKNITIKNSTGNEVYQLIKSEHIPVCPENYKFKKVGEVLHFTLFFPKIANSIKYIDLTENCSDACFNFKGIILDANTNKQIEKAYSLYSQRNNEASVNILQEIIKQNNDYPYGFMYFMIIKIFSETNQWEKVKNWYNQLQNNKIIDKEYYNEIIKTKKYY